MTFPTSQPFAWRKAVLAGLVAGAAFLASEVAIDHFFASGEEPWRPVQEKAALVLDEAARIAGDVGSGPDPLIFGTAVVVHMAISVLFALGLAWLVHYWSVSRAIAAGVAFGFALFLVASYGLSGWFPWLASSQDGPTLVAHLIFGAVTALTYKLLSKPEVFDPSLSPA